MKRIRVVLFLMAVIVLINGCQKETSFENGSEPAVATLQADGSGDCLPKNVVGTYEQGKVLNGTNDYIEVTLDVAKKGSYTIFTDTANNVFFRATGTFTTVGTNTVRLRGNRIPAAQGVFSFIVQYGTEQCVVQVSFLPAGASGPANFALAGTPGNCSAPDIQGTYGQGLVLNSTNKVVLNVNVTTIGTYSVTTVATNGITFTGSGTFLTTGAATIELTGSGTPTTAGPTTIPVTAGSSNCSFTITVAGAAVFAVNCGAETVVGTYETGTALGTGNTVTLDVNVTTAGVYSMMTTPVNGMTFTGSGTLAMGPQTITLTGSGTPNNAGDFDIAIPGVTPACTFEIVVDPASAPIEWKFTEAGVTYEGVSNDIQITTAGAITMLAYLGDNSSNVDFFTLVLADMAGGIQNNETYATTNVATNNVAFSVAGSGNTLYEADATMAGLTFQVRVTSHVPATKFIQGTFSGTVKDGGGVTKTITNGEFKGTYQ